MFSLTGNQTKDFILHNDSALSLFQIGNAIKKGVSVEDVDKIDDILSSIAVRIALVVTGKSEVLPALLIEETDEESNHFLVVLRAIHLVRGVLRDDGANHPKKELSDALFWCAGNMLFASTSLTLDDVDVSLMSPEEFSIVMQAIDSLDEIVLAHKRACLPERSKATAVMFGNYMSEAVKEQQFQESIH